MVAPSKFTKTTVSKILAGVRRGLPYHLAAAAAGISERTFYAWQRGEFPESADEALKQQFLQGLTRANGEAADRLTRRIHDASVMDWRAAAWILERRYPKDYGKDAEALQKLEELKAALEQWRAAGSPPISLRSAG